jgi:hypothetical protein
VAARPLRPATDRSLGEPLPHQPANRPQAHPQAPTEAGFARALLSARAHAGLSAISRRYPSLEARYPCVTHPSATSCRFRKSGRTFDLHVLGTPPAFILSQDQTRHPCDVSAHTTLSCGFVMVECDPGQADMSRPHALGCSQLFAPPPNRGRASKLTGTAVSRKYTILTVTVLLSTLQLSRCHQKQVLLASYCLLETDTERQEPHSSESRIIQSWVRCF